MNTYNILLVFLLLFLSASSSCDKNEPIPTDELEATGIVGNWEIQYREFGGISDSRVLCCEYIEFAADEQPNDLAGTFSTSSPNFQGDGTFVLHPSNGAIILTFSETGRQLSRVFQISESFLTFTYQENGNPVEENWRKVD